MLMVEKRIIMVKELQDAAKKITAEHNEKIEPFDNLRNKGTELYHAASAMQDIELSQNISLYIQPDGTKFNLCGAHDLTLLEMRQIALALSDLFLKEDK